MSFMAAAQRYFSSPKIRPQEASLPLIAELKQLSVVKILENGSQGQEERELEDVCSKALATLEDASQSLLAALHMVCKHLRFWQRKSQGLPRNQLRTMVLERGPWEFALSMTQFIKRAFSSSPDNRSLTEIASASVRERAALLTILRDRIASALGEVYTILDAFTVSTAEENWHEALLSALTSVHSALEQLEGSYDLPKITSGDIRSSIAALSIVLELRKHTAAAKDRERDTSALRRRIEQATELVADDISRVQDGVMILMAHYRRPSKAARLWVQYTAAGVGLAIVSSWLIRHSRLAGSDDLERWLHEGKHATVTFYQEHAVAPLKQIRDDLFETFRRRPSGIAEAEEVRLTAESLRRMLLEFAHVAKVDVEPTVSDQELMEILMTKYEKEVARPLQSLVGGELGRAMLIQVQKLKLDIETAMLELDQILRANEINFAALAALPALLVTIGLVSVVRQLFLYQQGRGREGRGRAAHLQRRMLMADVERILMESNVFEEGRFVSPQQMGMLVYSLHRLHQSVQRHAQRLGEWSRLEVDLRDLANPRLEVQRKLAIAARVERIYESFVPIPSLK